MSGLTREDAIEIARRCAKAKPQSYYAEPFEPHEWVVDAILAGAGEYHEAAMRAETELEADLDEMTTERDEAIAEIVEAGIALTEAGIPEASRDDIDDGRELDLAERIGLLVDRRKQVVEARNDACDLLDTALKCIDRDKWSPDGPGLDEAQDLVDRLRRIGAL